MKLKPLFLLGLLLFALIGVLEIKNASATEYEITLTLLEDCEVRSPNPNTNYGGHQYVSALNTTDPKERFSYFKFNLTEIPASATIEEATFYLWCIAQGAGGWADINNKPVHNQTWEEMSITWNDKPTVNNTILDTDGTDAANTWWDWNLTVYVAEKYTEGVDANLSCVIVNNALAGLGWVGQNYESEEHAQAHTPFLNVTYSIIPLDATPPLYLYPFGLNSTLNGSICQFTVNFSDNTGLTNAFLSWNNSGSWANVTYTLSGTVDLALWNQTLNTTSGLRIEYLFYVNDTSNNWNTTLQHFIYTNTKPIVLVVSDAGVLFIGFILVFSLLGGIFIVGRRKR